ncbi:class I SAM-dependent DNA methyltransferase [Mitsuokella jalaludinii]|uniref:class I SAM-dependent DNA methyltransferase n=1 Tax=Mitsuokella jalaludinii TaxID=187979 RepID=UPI0030790525
MADAVNIRKLEAELWESADLLRQGSKLTSNQYCMPVLGLIFLRYAYGRYKAAEKEILKDRPMRGGCVLPVEASDFKEKSALYLPKEAQYEYLVNLPEDIASSGLENYRGEPMGSLGEVVNNAMELIEEQEEQLQGILPKNYTDFTDELLAELLRIFNNKALDDIGGDVIGRIYEYFLNKFAKNVASDDGVFFTPKSLVKMIVNVLEPKSGILLDPACGSGGMFVQTGDFVNHAGMRANNTMTFYGQEKVAYNAQLCLMNMAVHGLTGRIKSGDEANTFYHDAHNLNGKCDYVMANPPFNVDKVKAESAEAADRLPFGMPAINKNKEVSNANYLWISYFYSYLNDHGRAGFVMPSSATDSSRKDKDIREALIKTGHVDVMISVANNFFYTKSLPCTLWFFDKRKSEELQDKVLFIDARNYYTVVDRTLNEWSDWQLKNLNAIVWLYRGETDEYRELISDYYTALESDDDFASIKDALEKKIQDKQKEAKEAVEAAKRKEKKVVQAKFDEEIAALDEKLTIAKEAIWLTEKFGEGIYADIPGLCKVADRKTILEEKGASLTPGAYVGVAPEEDDGVDFTERMKEIHQELLKLQKESNELMETILKDMEEMGV